MAEGLLTMFGKTYNTVGSADNNLLLLTRGDLKVRWGNKFIDLIKNGKINVDVDILKKIDSKDSIIKDGIYLIENKDNPEIWLQIGGTLVNLLGEVGTTYVSYVAPLEVTADDKFMALSNIGFFYESLEKVDAAGITNGLVYILDLQKLYSIYEGQILEYQPTLILPDPLIVGNIKINGKELTIEGSTGLTFGLNNIPYISILLESTTINNELITHASIMSEDYSLGNIGYSIYFDENKNWYCAEFDYVKIRHVLDYSGVINIKYAELRALLLKESLEPNMSYCITDFLNEWDIDGTVVYEDNKATIANKTTIQQKNVYPIVVKAISYSELDKNGYFLENSDWKIEYDPDFYYYVGDYTEILPNGTNIVHLFTKGRITKLIDERGNVANYDFKHRMFKHDTESNDRNDWLFTFNITNELRNTFTLKQYDSRNTRKYRDASLDPNIDITNNVIYLRNPTLKLAYIVELNNTLEVWLYVPETDYIIFHNCAIYLVHDNNILYVKGIYDVTADFYSNNIFGLILNERLSKPYPINFTFNNNTTGDIFITGDYQVKGDVPVVFENALVKTIFKAYSLVTNNVFKDIIGTEFKNNITNNIFKGIYNCLLDAPLLKNEFDHNLWDVEFTCSKMKENHFVGVINTGSRRSAYPIKAGNLSNNVIEDIYATAINCAGRSIINNVIGNIVGYTISNTNLEDNTIKELIGGSSGYVLGEHPNDSTIPTGSQHDLDTGGGNNSGGNNGGNSGGNNGGNTPVDPGTSGDCINTCETEWCAYHKPRPGTGYTEYNIPISNVLYYAWIPDVIVDNGINYYRIQPADPNNGSTLHTIHKYCIPYYAWF